MNIKKRSKLMRAYPDFTKDLEEVIKERISKGDSRKDLTTAEVTRMLRNTQGYRLSLKELRLKPRRKN